MSGQDRVETTIPGPLMRIDIPTAIRMVYGFDRQRARLRAALTGSGPAYYLRPADLAAAAERLRTLSAHDRT